MWKYLVFLMVGLVTLLGCVQPRGPVVTLETPANGSPVASLTPILAWAFCPNATKEKVGQVISVRAEEHVAQLEVGQVITAHVRLGG
jgi:hypothetical protein